MFLQELANKLKTKHKYVSAPGTVKRVFEIYEFSEKDESGNAPTIIRPERVDKKQKLNNALSS
jgi:hypothetical protein